MERLPTAEPRPPKSAKVIINSPLYFCSFDPLPAVFQAPDYKVALGYHFLIGSTCLYTCL
jgi:hypothetical protein